MVCASHHNSEVYAALQHGHFGAKVHRSRDGGQTWTEVDTPKYPPKPEDVPDVIDPMRKTPILWNLEMIWSMEQAQDGTLWCGTLPGGLFSSQDGADSWQLNLPLWSMPNRQRWFGGGYDFPGIHSICIDPRDPKRVTVGISCGGVWQSNDSGASWACRSQGMRAEYMPAEQAFDPDIQDPHRLVQCPGNPDMLWIQHHNGIFRSVDCGASWQEIADVKPSTFGFAVAVHPNQPDTAWFVPAARDSDRYPVDGALVVTRTRDGGKSFECLHRGLPQCNAYHLVYRHALAIDSSGSVLVMGSTTGGLWVSENGGEDWNTITQDFPPIFCVRCM
jgi:photosystem II stability/assembly factor-like uncharacterized protein